LHELKIVPEERVLQFPEELNKLKIVPEELVSQVPEELINYKQFLKN
jgi:hypothetical protein